MSILDEPPMDEEQREREENRRALIVADVQVALFQHRELRVSLHKLNTASDDGLYAAYYQAEKEDGRLRPLFMCTLSDTFSRAGAEADVRKWLVKAAMVDEDAIEAIALDLRSAPALLIAS